MSRTRILAAVAALLLTGAGVAGIAGFIDGLRSMPIEYLQSCMQEQAFPGSRYICRQTLYRYHPTAEEVQLLNSRAGASYLLAQQDEQEARKLLKHFIARGLDVNSPDQRVKQMLWSALHTESMAANTVGVKLLLEVGAQHDLKDAQGRTALDLVREQMARMPHHRCEYADVVAILESAGTRY